MLLDFSAGERDQEQGHNQGLGRRELTDDGEGVLVCRCASLSSEDTRRRRGLQSAGRHRLRRRRLRFQGFRAGLRGIRHLRRWIREPRRWIGPSFWIRLPGTRCRCREDGSAEEGPKKCRESHWGSMSEGGTIPPFSSSTHPTKNPFPVPQPKSRKLPCRDLFQGRDGPAHRKQLLVAARAASRVPPRLARPPPCPLLPEQLLGVSSIRASVLPPGQLIHEASSRADHDDPDEVIGEPESSGQSSTRRNLAQQ
jgi:hypothetical protein